MQSCWQHSLLTDQIEGSKRAILGRPLDALFVVKTEQRGKGKSQVSGLVS
jgi:hypothetical protein